MFGCPVNKTRLASFADSLPVKVMLLSLVLQVVFVLSNTAANCLPRPVIESHAQGSESSALLSDVYVYDHRVAAGPVCFDNNRFIIEVAQQKDQGSPFKTMTVAEIDDVTKAGGITHQQYYRYWHGWQLLTNECLPVYWRYRRCRGACGRSGDCRLRLRLRCLAEAVFKASDVGFPCNPAVLDQSVFQFYR